LPTGRETSTSRRVRILDEQARRAEVEGNVREAIYRRDETGAGVRRWDVEAQADRITATVIGALVIGPRFRLRGRGGRIV